MQRLFANAVRRCRSVENTGGSGPVISIDIIHGSLAKRRACRTKLSSRNLGTAFRASDRIAEGEHRTVAADHGFEGGGGG